MDSCSAEAAATAEGRRDSSGELSMLTGVGIPPAGGNRRHRAESQGSFQSSLRLLHDRVAAGVSLAAAMGEQPVLF